MVSLSVGLAVLQSLRITCKHISTDFILSSRLRSVAAILSEHLLTRPFPPCWINLYSIHVQRNSVYPNQTARPYLDLDYTKALAVTAADMSVKASTRSVNIITSSMLMLGDIVEGRE
jgi:hypothetical protein